MMSNHWNTVIYIGVTSDIEKRVYQHKNGMGDGFTKTYNCHKLVWVEQGDSIIEAIAREKQIKAGSRAAKIRLIEGMNPGWKDLSDEWQ